MNHEATKDERLKAMRLRVQIARELRLLAEEPLIEYASADELIAAARARIIETS